MRKMITAALLVGVMLAASNATAEDLDAVEKQITKAWKEHKTIKADMEMTGRVGQGPQAGSVKGSGACEFMRKDGDVLSRIQMQMKITHSMGGEEMTMEQQNLLVVDGEYAWVLSEVMGQKSALKTKPDAKMTNDPEAMFDELRKDYNLKLLSPEKVDGREAFVIEGVAKEDTTSTMPKMRLFFGKDTGFLLKSVAFDTAGEPAQTMVYKNVQVDVPIDPKRFEFEVPEGVQVMDQTKTQAP